MKMNVITAKSAGFCFGVKRAVETVYEQVEKEKEKQIYTYGPIIHNEEVIKDMKKRGVKVLNTEEELDTLEQMKRALRQAGFDAADVDMLYEEEIQDALEDAGLTWEEAMDI